MSNQPILKLAISNLKRNKAVSIPFLISTSITVMLYFLMLSLMLNKSLIELPGGYILNFIFILGIFVISLFTILFLISVNQTLIKKRKKEFGLYTVLGLEKKHITMMVLWENCILYVLAIAIGLICAIAIGPLVMMFLLSLLQTLGELPFTFDWLSLGITLLIFATLYLITSCINLYQIYSANPIELLHDEKKGDTKVRFLRLKAFLGLVLLLFSYGLAISVKSMMFAIMAFFFASLLVIVATNLLFQCGSQVFLRFLQKRKKLYYQPSNFIAISMLIHRMKQNAVKLASICILSTMVLVAIGTTSSLYFGQKDILSTTYPDDLNLLFTQELTTNQRNLAQQLIEETAKKNFVEVEEVLNFNFADSFMFLYGDKTEPYQYSIEDEINPWQEMGANTVDINLILLDDYNRIAEDTATLMSGETILISNKAYEFPSLTLGDQTLQVKQVRHDTPFIQRKYSKGLAIENSDSEATMYVVVADEATRSTIQSKIQDTFSTKSRLAVNYKGDSNQRMSFVTECNQALHALEIPISISRNLDEGALEFKGIYGGFLFVGIFFSILFLVATALIIYFKQVSDSLEDRDQYIILQKVGMDEKAVSKTIHRQILIVFFLPLGTALLHTLFASPLIRVLLQVLLLRDPVYVYTFIPLTAFLFAVIYFLYYLYTSRVVQKNVSWRN